MTSAELKLKYKVPVYRNWKDVPVNLVSRTAAHVKDIVIPDDAKPDAIKNAADVWDKDRIFKLFDINKYKK